MEILPAMQANFDVTLYAVTTSLTSLCYEGKHIALYFLQAWQI